MVATPHRRLLYIQSFLASSGTKLRLPKQKAQKPCFTSVCAKSRRRHDMLQLLPRSHLVPDPNLEAYFQKRLDDLGLCIA